MNSEIVSSTQIVEYSQSAAGIADLRNRLEKVVFDVTKPEGMRAAKAARRECIDLRVALEAKRKEVKGPHLERGRLIDSEAERLRIAIEELEEPIDAQIKAAEEKERAAREEAERVEANRVALLNGRLTQLTMIPLEVSGLPAADIEAALQRLREVNVGADVFQEFAPQAVEAKLQSLVKLEGMIVRAKANEVEAARLAAESARLEAQRREQDERERKDREAEARRVKARRRIDELSLMPNKYAGMPSANIATAITALESAKAEAKRAGSDFADALAGFVDEWFETADRVIDQLRATMNLSRAQEEQAAEAKAKADRDREEAEARREIQRVAGIPASMIGKDSTTIAEALESLQTEHQNATEGTAIRKPWGTCERLAADWLDAAEASIEQLGTLQTQAAEREQRAAEAAARVAEDAERERKAREHAAMEEEQKRAQGDAVVALRNIAEVAADLKGIPDHGIARSKIAGIATGTLAMIADRKPRKPRTGAVVGDVGQYP